MRVSGFHAMNVLANGLWQRGFNLFGLRWSRQLHANPDHVNCAFKARNTNARTVDLTPEHGKPTMQLVNFTMHLAFQPEF